MNACLGLDIGGANIKVASVDPLGNITDARSIPFPLWQKKDQLAVQLHEIVEQTAANVDVAVTMTGELADCFESRQAGVKFIVQATASCCRDRKLAFYGTDGNWYQPESAVANWEMIAAANWHAIARFASRFLPAGSGFLIDVGSTTTDIIPVSKGLPTPTGRTDFQRLRASELFYAGVSRTPVSSLMSSIEVEDSPVGLAREYFATINDVFILTGDVEERPECVETADGRPATKKYSAMRIARMVCEDADQLRLAVVDQIAKQTKAKLIELSSLALRGVVERSPDLPANFVISGQGEWFAKQVIDGFIEHGKAIEGVEDSGMTLLSSKIGLAESRCAAAVAVASLWADRGKLGWQESECQKQTPANCGSPESKPSVERPVRVVKLGGSLLNWRETPAKIAAWLATQPQARNVWVIGGGEFVDLVRRWDETTPLDEQEAHVMCIDLMSITSRLVQSWFPNWKIVSSLDELSSSVENNVIFDPSVWLPAKTEVPASWTFTSDSCAALLTSEIEAGELVLLKSRDVDAELDRASWSEDGIVDLEFAKWSATIENVQIVNLRIAK